MAIEVEYGKFRGDDEIDKQTEKISPGSYKRIQHLRPSNDVLVFLKDDNTRGTLQIKGVRGLVYAIKYYGEDDTVGEIADLITTDSIELAQGDEVLIIKDGVRHSQEMWFYLDHSSGNIETSTDPIESIPFWGDEINQIR